jgi:hypothetical protein
MHTNGIITHHTSPTLKHKLMNQMDPQEARKTMGDEEEYFWQEIRQLEIKADVKMINKLYHIYENTNCQKTRSILNTFR